MVWAERMLGARPPGQSGTLSPELWNSSFSPSAFNPGQTSGSQTSPEPSISSAWPHLKRVLDIFLFSKCPLSLENLKAPLQGRPLSTFPSADCWPGILGKWRLFRQSFLTPISFGALSVFSSRSFRFRSSIHLEFIFLCRVIDTCLVSFFYLWTSSFPRVICGRCCLFSCVCFRHLCQMLDGCRYLLTFESWILFH